MGEFRKSLPEMKMKFLKKFRTKESRKQFIKRYKPVKIKKILEPF
jgi:hypothetical protein